MEKDRSRDSEIQQMEPAELRQELAAVEHTLAEKDRRIVNLRRRLQRANRMLASDDAQDSATLERVRGQTSIARVLSHRIGDLRTRVSGMSGVRRLANIVKSAGSGTTGSRRRVGSRSSPRKEDGIKRVQVGCGPHNLMEGWWNVDIAEFPGIDEVMDATKPWPYAGLDYVFGEHFLEHLSLEGAVAFLKHAGNSLSPGGRLRLSTPNLEWVLRANHYPLGPAEPEERVLGTLRMNRAFHGWGHQFLWTEDMLRHVLAGMGFAEVCFFTYGESRDPNLINLERHGKFRVHEGHPSVIVAEAARGDDVISASPRLIALLNKEFLRYTGARL